METNSVEALLDDILNGTLDKSQDIPEDDAKAKVRNDTSVAVAMNAVPVGDTKAVSDETVLQEPEPDDTAAIAENILIESENKVKAEEELGVPGSSSKKFVTVTDYAAIVMDMHGFDKDHNCVVAEVPVIITATKLMDMPVNYCSAWA